MLGWADPRLRIASDPPRRARRRQLQGWWREVRCSLPPGHDSRGVPRNNLFPSDAIRENPALNFLNEKIAAYVDQRVPEVLASGGTLDEERLRRNLLSSMPLCFNLFGMLRSVPDSAARVLAKVTGLAIDRIETMEVEWVPEGRHPLGDRTAFDAWVVYRDGKGRRGFLGVETKYTEPFSRRIYDKERYREITDWPDSGFFPGAADSLRAVESNQLWRNALLAVAVRRALDFDFGHVWVLALAADPHVEAAVSVLERNHRSARNLLLSSSLEELVAAAKYDLPLESWAKDFDERYLCVPL